MMKQTRNALIYSDLALFLLDSREGINYNDVALYKWLVYHQLKLPQELKTRHLLRLTDSDRYEQIMREEQQRYVSK